MTAMNAAAEQDFRRFGPYVLLRCSGAGGFGRIDLALKGSAQLAKVCVVKRMQTDERSPELAARFRREAEIALQLAHGAIAQTVGVEEIEGELCLLQEFVDGVNLRHLEAQCKPELVPLPVALHIVREVGRALAYAHSLGIVHRDVTPENIMLSYGGEVKLIDFGIARRSGDATLTQAGVVVGRETYTAPEVWAGNKADPRSDVFSLGVVLWQLVTGEDFQRAQDKDGDAVPDPVAWNAGLNSELAAVVQRAVATEPSARYQSVLELVETLSRFVPSGFVAEPALASFLARHFNVDRERKMLADDVAAAKKLLGKADDPEAGEGVPRSRSAVVILAIGAVALAVGATAWWGAQRTKASIVPRPQVTEPSAEVTAPASSTPEPQVPSTTREPEGTIPVSSEVAAVPQRPMHAVKRRPPDQKAPEHPAPEQERRSASEILNRARVRWQEGDVDSAAGLGREAVAAGGGAEAHAFLGMVLLRKGERSGAEDELTTALRLDPGSRKASQLLERLRHGSGTQE